MFAAGAIREIAQGRGGAPLVAVAVFWVLGLVLILSGLLRFECTVRDPEGEAARRSELRERALAQPREKMLRKAALFMSLLSAAPIIMGAVFLVASSGSSVSGWVLVALGVGLGLFFIRALRHPHI